MGVKYKKNRIKSRICWAIALVLAAAMLVISVLPFIFMVLNSFKGKFEMLTKGVFALPDSLNMANYQEVLAKGFFRYFFNSVFVLVISVVFCCSSAVCILSTGPLQV